MSAWGGSEPPTGPLDPSEIVRRIRAGGSPALVALSGGVDSSLVAALAYEALGAGATAITLTGPAVSRDEVARAERAAAAIGIAHAELRVDPLLDPSYRANPANRCFFCRSVETEALLAEGRRAGVRQYLDGIHLDDLGEDRPGIAAMDRAGFLHPLVAAGWRKAEVRREAYRRRLPNWDAPSDACLASRIAHGQPIEADVLGRVERAEAWLRSEGFARVRVRVHGSSARIEVGPQEVPRLSEARLRARVLEEVRALGFDPVTIDPAGYRGGGSPPAPGR